MRADCGLGARASKADVQLVGKLCCRDQETSLGAEASQPTVLSRPRPASRGGHQNRCWHRFLPAITDGCFFNNCGGHYWAAARAFNRGSNQGLLWRPGRRRDPARSSGGGRRGGHSVVQPLDSAGAGTLPVCWTVVSAAGGPAGRLRRDSAPPVVPPSEPGNSGCEIERGREFAK